MSWALSSIKKCVIWISTNSTFQLCMTMNHELLNFVWIWAEYPLLIEIFFWFFEGYFKFYSFLPFLLLTATNFSIGYTMFFLCYWWFVFAELEKKKHLELHAFVLDSHKICLYHYYQCAIFRKKKNWKWFASLFSFLLE